MTRGERASKAAFKALYSDPDLGWDPMEWGVWQAAGVHFTTRERERCVAACRSEQSDAETRYGATTLESDYQYELGSHDTARKLADKLEANDE